MALATDAAVPSLEDGTKEMQPLLHKRGTGGSNDLLLALCDPCACNAVWHSCVSIIPNPNPNQEPALATDAAVSSLRSGAKENATAATIKRCVDTCSCRSTCYFLLVVLRIVFMNHPPSQ